MEGISGKTLKNDLLLILTAVIWGFAFTAQRAGMQYVGPFTFNGVRFILGAVSLVPVMLFGRKRAGTEVERKGRSPSLLLTGFIAGLFIFTGASLQQIGLLYTTAGKSGFITGLYVVIVPLLGMFFRHKTGRGRWLGVILAAAGLYLLSITESFTIELGDLLTLIGAVFWAGHVLLISRYSKIINPVKLSFVQYLFCTAFSLVAAGFTETMEVQSVLAAWLPLLYGGVCSVGIAYTLQVVAQRKAHPAHAAIILSMEGVFAVLGGMLILGETLSPRGVLGCSLMLAGMLVSQGDAILARRKITGKIKQTADGDDGN